MSDIIIWIFFLFLFIIIVGLYISQYTPLQLGEKKDILKMEFEHFHPDISSSDDQAEGASTLYNWDEPNETINIEMTSTSNQTSKPVHNKPILKSTSSQLNNVPKCSTQQIFSSIDCSQADITQNKNIDKYILKSSIPPCPDMSEFITKNMMNANPDLNDYILKSEVKPCEKIDLSQYLLKSEIPACPECPICPECPLCPVCPVCPVYEEKKCKLLSEYNIQDHPDISNYISKTELHDKYILKKDETNEVDKKNETNPLSHLNSSTNASLNTQDNSKITTLENNESKKYDNIEKKHDNIEDKHNNQSNKFNNIENKHDNIEKKHNNESNKFDKRNDMSSSNVIGYYAGDNVYAAV